jgi:hypothetical protein
MRRLAAIGLCVGLLASAALAQGVIVYPPTPPDLSGYAAKTDMPQPATVPPPGVQVDGATGSTTAQYALANHTHATSVQRTRMTISPAGQPVRWTFAKPYDAGVVPVVVCTAENVAGATRPFVVNTVGAPTNAYTDLIVFQASVPNLSIGNLSLTLFGSAASGTLVNCQAAKPTQ